MEEAAMFFDKELRGVVEDIVVGGGPFFRNLQWRLASIPIRFGGVEFVLSSRGFLIHVYGFQGTIMAAIRSYFER
jgi:hypothetical protein